ncbi:peptidoglycan editing factor PgeF [Candidatus Parcubacteria bacterium]|nr:peptidoglycan editing factor PgeF [Candidatus Parcubacteria bacterium]
MRLSNKNLVCGISKKDDGSMKLLGNNFDDHVLENRKKFFTQLNIDSKRIVSAGLQHGNNIKIVGQQHAGQFIQNTDGLITNKKNLFLTVTVADCLPIYFYDFKKEVIGIAHAGWQGIVKNIVNKTIQVMTDVYKSGPGNILVYIGPHIQKCHFEIKNEAIKKLNKYSKYFVIKNNKKIFVDLSKIVKEQLLNENVSDNNIEVSRECTYCLNNKYFSYRRDKPKNIKAMIAYIGLK